MRACRITAGPSLDERSIFETRRQCKTKFSDTRLTESRITERTMLDHAVLLLNQNYEPLTTCSARRAIVMVWTGKAEMVESAGVSVRSVSMAVDVPSIIRLLIFVRITTRDSIQLSKQNILKRDRHVCQYCGTHEGLMTVDHIVPRSLGGRDTWENLVCACSRCNNKKGDRTIAEANMKLLSRPRKPSMRSFIFHNRSKIRSTWSAYLKIG